MKQIRRSTQFKKDYKRARKSGKNLAELQKVIYQLAAGKPLDPSYNDHALLGNYRGCRESGRVHSMHHNNVYVAWLGA